MGNPNQIDQPRTFEDIAFGIDLTIYLDNVDKAILEKLRDDPEFESYSTAIKFALKYEYIEYFKLWEKCLKPLYKKIIFYSSLTGAKIGSLRGVEAVKEWATQFYQIMGINVDPITGEQKISQLFYLENIRNRVQHFEAKPEADFVKELQKIGVTNRAFLALLKKIRNFHVEQDSVYLETVDKNTEKYERRDGEIDAIRKSALDRIDSTANFQKSHTEERLKQYLRAYIKYPKLQSDILNGMLKVYLELEELRCFPRLAREVKEEGVMLDYFELCQHYFSSQPQGKTGMPIQELSEVTSWAKQTVTLKYGNMEVTVPKPPEVDVTQQHRFNLVIDGLIASESYNLGGPKNETLA